MPQVYVATQGSYSDYHVLGIFSTREKANEYAAAFEGVPGDKIEIETFDLDVLPLPVTHDAWSCHIKLNDGAISQERSYKSLHLPGERGSVYKCHTREPAAQATSFVSAEHCHKIAAEYRQRWLREESLGQWGELLFDEAGNPCSSSN